MTDRRFVGPVAPPPMSEALRSEYDLLQGHHAALAYYFSEYESLFGTSRERIELLNQTAPVFFSMIFNTLWSEILMQIARVAGPVETQDRDGNHLPNLTIQRLPMLVDPKLKRRLRVSVDAAVEAAKFITPARNKVLAHFDLPTALDRDTAGVTLGSRRQVAEAIAAIEVVLDAIGAHYYGRRLPWLHHGGWGITDDLLELIELGWRTQSARAQA